MKENYTGWKLMDTVIIVARPYRVWDKESHLWKKDELQGYVVDPSNKQMLKNARSWGTVFTGEYIYDEDGHVKEAIKADPQEYIYKNENFTLELKESANASSQGGKLSFWNCKITAPDGKSFIVGIDANLLLDVLRFNDVVKGVIQSPLIFARRNGNIGMLSETMESYQTALKDDQLRVASKKGKTTKHKVGHVYSTLTQKNIYFGKYYQWYEPIKKKNEYQWTIIVGFRKLKTPKEHHLFPDYRDGKTKFSDYFDPYYWWLVDKLPARKEENIVITMDRTMQDFCDELVQRKILDVANNTDKNSNSYVHEMCVGITPNKESYTMPEDVKNALRTLGYDIIDEETI